MASTPSTTFEVEISIIDVQNLFGFDLTLYYNTASLDLIEAVPMPPWSRYMIVKDQIDEAAGTYRLATVALAPASPFDGGAMVAKLTFIRANIGDDSFNLAHTVLTDHNGDAIPHSTSGLIIQAIPVHDIAITEVRGWPRGVYQGDTINIDVIVKNKGNFPETFDVTVYADRNEEIIGDEYIVGVQTVSNLPAKTSRNLCFVWDTDNVVYGTYWISAQAPPVDGESNTWDNFLKCGEFIGGIYAPPHIRWLAGIWTNITSAFIMVSLTLAGTVGIKKYWFP